MYQAQIHPFEFKGGKSNTTEPHFALTEIQDMGTISNTNGDTETCNSHVLLPMNVAPKVRGRGEPARGTEPTWK